MFPELITVHYTSKGFDMNYRVEQVAELLSDIQLFDYRPSVRQMFLELAKPSEHSKWFYFDTMKITIDHKTPRVIITAYSYLGYHLWSGMSINDAFDQMLVPIWSRFA